MTEQLAEPTPCVAIAPKPKPVVHSTSDMYVGMMVEGPYEWRPFCFSHGEGVLNIYPGRKHYKLSLWDYRRSGGYTCSACNTTLVKEPS